MRQLIRNSIAGIGQYIPFSILRNNSKLPVFLPFYHTVSNVPLDYINSYTVRTQKEFEKELDFLLLRYSPVGLDEIIASNSKNNMHLSFDDGLKECYSIIAPVLKKKGIPATFFVNSDFVDNKQLFHRYKQSILESKSLLSEDERRYFIQNVNVLNDIAINNNVDFSNYKPYMTIKEISALKKDGFTIGAHSINHPEMWTLSEDDQYNQIESSMKWVGDHFNPDIKAFSFPFTDDGITQSLFERLERNGIIDISFGTAGLKHDNVKNHYQRVAVETSKKWSMKKIVHYEYFYYFVRSIFGKNKVIR